jgi:hypothetical protein
VYSQVVFLARAIFVFLEARAKLGYHERKSFIRIKVGGSNGDQCGAVPNA